MIKHVWHDVLIWASGNATCIRNLPSCSHKSNGFISKSNLQRTRQLYLARRCIWLDLFWIWPWAFRLNMWHKAWTKYSLVGLNFTETRRIFAHKDETEKSLLTVHSYFRMLSVPGSKGEDPVPSHLRDILDSLHKEGLKVLHLQNQRVKKKGRTEKLVRRGTREEVPVLPLEKAR